MKNEGEMKETDGSRVNNSHLRPNRLAGILRRRPRFSRNWPPPSAEICSLLLRIATRFEDWNPIITGIGREVWTRERGSERFGGEREGQRSLEERELGL